MSVYLMTDIKNEFYNVVKDAFSREFLMKEIEKN